MQTAYRHQGISCFILFLFLLGSYAALGQGVQKPVPKEVTYGTDGSINVRYGYQEYLPVGYDTQPEKKWPLIIHMVGIGERGDGSVEELDTIAGIGIPRLIERGRDYPFLIMSPQPTGDQSKPLGEDNPGTFDTDTIANFVDYVISNYNVAPNRIYITAFSAAAQKAAQYIIKNPGEVTAFVPISGNMKPGNLKGNFCSLGNLPIWAFHNNIDETIPPEGSINFYKSLNDCEPAPVYPPKLTLYKVKGDTHDAWTKTYNNAALDETGSNADPAYDPFDISIYDWFLQYSKGDMLVADAGGDQTIFLPENTVILEGSGAPNNNITFQWTQIGTTPNTPTLSGQTTATLTASNLVAGNYQFELTITDATNNTNKDTVNVFVRSFSADAGKDTTVTVPAEVALQGQAIDATKEEAQAFSYQWTQITGTTIGDTTISDVEVIIDDSTTTTASASLSTPGTYRFAFAITDNVGATARDTVDIIARYTNDSLIANAGSDTLITIPIEDTVVLEGSATDPYHEIISYQWNKVSGPEVVLTDANTVNLKLTNLQKGEYLFSLTVTNNNSGTASDTVKVTVGTSDAQLTANAGEDTTVTLLVDTLKIVGSGSDPVNTITGYSWRKIEGPEVEIINADSATLMLSQLTKGGYTFELTVTNDNNAQAKDTVQVSVTSTNDSLTANAGQDVSEALPVDQIVLKGTGSDPYNEITAYQWTQISGEKLDTSDPATDSLVIKNPSVGSYSFTFTVTNDFEGTATDTVNVTIIQGANPDVEVVAIVNPLPDNFPYFSEQHITVQLKNSGNVDINDSLSVTYQLNDQQAVTEQVDQIIAVGETIAFTFAAKGDLTTYGNYILQVIAALTGDVNAENDSARVSLQWLEIVNTPTYTETFEDGGGGWQSVSNHNGWQLGNTPNLPDDEGNAWFTNLEGNYVNNDTSYLISPIFNFSDASNDPVITYELRKDIDPSDTLYVSISLDGGTTWITIQKVTGSDEDHEGAWSTVSHVLEGAAGQDNVIIRFAFVSDGEGTATGAGIDNISICQSAPAIDTIEDVSLLFNEMPLEIPLTISNANLSEVNIIAFSDNQEVIADDAIQVVNENGEAKLRISADTLGNANITVVVQQECSGSMSFAVAVVDKITGLDDKLEDVAIVYPNPSEGIFYLNWKEQMPKDAAVNIFNAQGRLIKSFQPETVRGNFMIDLSTRAAGTYMLVIRAEGKTRTYRLIKK